VYKWKTKVNLSDAEIQRVWVDIKEAWAGWSSSRRIHKFVPPLRRNPTKPRNAIVSTTAYVTIKHQEDGPECPYDSIPVVVSNQFQNGEQRNVTTNVTGMAKMIHRMCGRIFNYRSGDSRNAAFKHALFVQLNVEGFRSLEGCIPFAGIV
jgi:hypothetical protein